MRLIDPGAMGLLIPLLYLAAAAYARVSEQPMKRRWSVAHASAGLALGLTGVVAALRVWHVVSGTGAIAGDPLVAVDGVALAMLGLATTLGLAIVRFSRTYLEGEADQPQYIAALLTTLASVTTVAISNHLGLLAAGWTATSLSLHQLLTFYRSRPWALIAAHKKFLVSRLAEASFLVALVLLSQDLHTLSVTGLARRLEADPWLSTSSHIAVILFAAAAILKSAQLPVHGWLTQVMEAPTPVSALLHAGVVNLGGFVLIRLAPLVSAVPAAQALLVLTGGVTALFASVAMTTRISVKVKLAWSTCAQMGFMLLECGLGLYELALLHLVAHSVYKAHAFLSAAGTVAAVRERAQYGHSSPTSGVAGWWGWAAAGVVVATASAAIWRFLGAPAVAWTVVATSGIALAPVVRGAGRGTLRARLHACLAAAGLAQLPTLWHLLLAATGIGLGAHASTISPLWLLGCVGIIFAVQAHVMATPTAPAVASLHQWCFSGFYLDEWLTRLAFRVWPLRMPPLAGARVPHQALAGTGSAL